MRSFLKVHRELIYSFSNSQLVTLQNEVRSVTSRLDKLEKERETDAIEAQKRHDDLVKKQNSIELAQKAQSIDFNTQFKVLLEAINLRNQQESAKPTSSPTAPKPAEQVQVQQSADIPPNPPSAEGREIVEVSASDEVASAGTSTNVEQNEERSPKQRTLALMAQKRHRSDSDDDTNPTKRRFIPSKVAENAHAAKSIEFVIPAPQVNKADKKQTSNSKTRRIKALNDAERQQLRNDYTQAHITIPDWFLPEWSVPAYVTNRFYWSHEQTRVHLGQLRQHKGPTYPSFRNQFHAFGLENAKKYDEDRGQKLQELKKVKDDINLYEILPWYRVHQKNWDRAHIHPQTNRHSIPEGKFKFLTSTKFLDNFMDRIGW